MDAKAKAIMAEKLRQLRKEAGKTQEEVAMAVGISIPALKSYEGGERGPRDEVKKAIAFYYGVSIESLFFNL